MNRITFRRVSENTTTNHHARRRTLGRPTGLSVTRSLALLAMAPIGLNGIALADNLPIQIDGAYQDWPPTAVIATDPTGDDGSTGIDFTELSAANDEVRLFLRFDTTVEVQGDEQQNLVFAIDSDRNPSTGTSFEGIGAELIWRLGDREGFFDDGSGSVQIGHSDVGLVLAATVSDEQFELALDRDAEPEGEALFPASDFDIVLIDDDNGDVIGPVTYTFANGTQPVTSIGFGKDDGDHVRVVSFNVENNGLFEGGGRQAAFSRILNAADPDVFLFSELWDHDASETASRVETFLPSSGGESWSAVKLDAGNVIVSRFPILQSWEILPGSRLTAALLDPRPRYDTDLLVIVNHWSCCGADGNRQNQADALIAFLRDARTVGGDIDLAPDTPIIAGGDFNLVGLRRQLETLTTGDIADNGTWGPDSAPDWDGSDLDIATNRHPDSRLIYTWRRDASSFYPGKLDYIGYTGSAATIHNNFTIETRTMTSASLSAAGLQALDTEVASDHAALVADFSLGQESSSVPGNGSEDVSESMVVRTIQPNPFRETTIVQVQSSSASVVGEVYDASGRFVTSLQSSVLGSGAHQFEWSGVDQDGRRVAPGVFYLRIRDDSREQTAKITRLR